MQTHHYYKKYNWGLSLLDTRPFLYVEGETPLTLQRYTRKTSENNAESNLKMIEMF